MCPLRSREGNGRTHAAVARLYLPEIYRPKPDGSMPIGIDSVEIGVPGLRTAGFLREV
jgi:hypothetical protein